MKEVCEMCETKMCNVTLVLQYFMNGIAGLKVKVGSVAVEICI